MLSLNRNLEMQTNPFFCIHLAQEDVPLLIRATGTSRKVVNGAGSSLGDGEEFDRKPRRPAAGGPRAKLPGRKQTVAPVILQSPQFPLRASSSVDGNGYVVAIPKSQHCCALSLGLLLATNALQIHGIDGTSKKAKGQKARKQR